MILYFSGTGNSRWCAELLGMRLAEECVDSFHLLKKGIGGTFYSEKPWVFVAPTYAWRLPHIYSNLLKKSTFEGNRDAYFVMTCGSEIGDAAKENRALCDQLGLRDRGTLTVAMPENYIALFDVPEANAVSAMMKDARTIMEEAAERIRAGRDLPELKTGLLDRIKSGPVNPLFYRLIVKAKAFYATDACTGCGKCVTGCVLGNIRLQEGKPVWDKNCTHCMACICGCPAGAIEYGKASRGKVRYQCPHYEE